jgi:hypothetical protein
MGLTAAGLEKGSMFFFEKKTQKTFAARRLEPGNLVRQSARLFSGKATFRCD